MTEPVFSVSDAIAVLNQTLDHVYPSMTIVGELSNFKIAKEKWVYADLKDDYSKMRLFGTVFQLPGPIEDGMMLEIVGEPRIHPQFGFSFQVRSMRPVGEGTIKKAADLLRQKLEKEGLFAPERKRMLPFPPKHIALITSDESAAYADFIKIITARWPLLKVDVYHAAVQGQAAVSELVENIELVNKTSLQPEVLVMIRGGGSADDLAAFSSEQVTRAVAASRVPTMVAIGHEVDESLAELVADARASTPSNAAELLVPDSQDIMSLLHEHKKFLSRIINDELQSRLEALGQDRLYLEDTSNRYISDKLESLQHVRSRLESYHPKQVLSRGFALVRKNGVLLKSQDVQPGDKLEIELSDKLIEATTDKAGKK